MDRINLQRESLISSPKERIANADAKERNERRAENNQALRRKEKKFTRGGTAACTYSGTLVRCAKRGVEWMLVNLALMVHAPPPLWLFCVACAGRHAGRILRSTVHSQITLYTRTHNTCHIHSTPSSTVMLLQQPEGLARRL